MNFCSGIVSVYDNHGFVPFCTSIKSIDTRPIIVIEKIKEPEPILKPMKTNKAANNLREPNWDNGFNVI